ncbi:MULTISPECIES: hypothetical protein [Chryseobacterium]|jgi:hypothetical protein|uniref:CHAT domain-containing protein n=2 Tax=Chryseobacterium TaxID=59732 RepID=A0A101CE99_9FLAO|nr:MULTISPECIES: hypothetical protein [Chryseobacterium]KUJ54633.1 hypothetical protein AR686_17130 [Chryseobacterium aquaticum subsp. greenlandense]QQV01750.1 hypothetical protein I6I61_11700 [Chryseobacterium sp. FDAARGOS 1104]VFB05044.1 Uncharacterised protein [Chryseobacterium taihuense]
MITAQEIGVAIIESLRKSDKRTGRELFETTLKYIKFEKQFIENEYFEVADKYSFFKTLDLLYDNAKNRNKFYFLHFEVHGDNNGLELQSGEEVDWSEILPYFEKINILYKNNLSIYLAVCEGNAVLRKVNPFSRSPFAYIVGSFFEIYERDTLYAFEQFYTTFFKEFKIIEALEEMQKVAGKSNFTLISSHHILNMLLEIEKKHNDKKLLYNKLEELFPLHDRNDPFTNLIVQNIEKSIESIFLKINEDYFLMKDLK